MANFNGLILTQAGANLQDKIAVSGATLQFTRAAIGDGLWPAGLDPTTLTALVGEKQSLPIQGLADEGTGQHKISLLVDNTGLAQGFMTREIGVFADDPDLGEILYQVTSADSPDYLPPDGGATHIEMALDLLVVTSSASSVTAVINEGLVYATKADVTAEAAARQDADNVLAASLAAHEGGADVHPISGVDGLQGVLDYLGQGPRKEQVNTWQRPQEFPEQALAIEDGQVAWDMGLVQCARVVLSEDVTAWALSNPLPGTVYLLRLTQDATGGRVVTFPPEFRWPGGSAPVVTADAGKTDLVTCYVVAADMILCSAVQGYE